MLCAGRSARDAVVESRPLHEHEIPDLKPLLFGFCRSGSLSISGPHVVMQLGAGTAGTRRSGRPEIALVFPVAVDLRIGQTDLAPLVIGVVVIGVHRRDESLLGHADDIGDQLPGPGLCFGLEVVTQREIAEHLKHREMRGVADFINVRRAEALLDRCQPVVWRLRFAEEIGLERHHAGAREEQSRITRRGERRRRHCQVVAFHEKVGKCLSDRLCVHSSGATLRVHLRTLKPVRAERELQFPSIRRSPHVALREAPDVTQTVDSP